MEPRRYLRCLGQPSLFAANGEPIRFRTKKPLALLIYIAVDSRSHRRERLAELLWPKVSATEARHSLATALSTLRPRLGPGALETSRDHVRLSPDRVDLDLHRLEVGDVLGTEVTGPLEVAAFLDGFDIPDSSEFMHWKDRQQARLLPLVKDALVVLIDRCRRTGNSRQIERLADRMLALDDLSEEAIRAKMEARAFAGDRLTALEFYEEWRKKLAEELQAVPSDLVEGMAVRLRRRGWERTTLANIPTVPTDQWRNRPFIGRTTEYRVLYELWEGVQRGEPGHAMILGDSGVGKTTLVEKLTTAAGLEGAAISRVQCYDLEREIPYSTVSSLILGLLDRPGVSATAGESLAELARTVPEVRRRFTTIPQSTESQGETARIRLTEAFHDMLSAIAEEHPVILVVDDLHLADDVSLAVLHLMMRRSRGQPIMVLLIARPGELPHSPQAAKLRAGARPLGIHEIELLPLGNEDSLELLQSLIPPDEPHPSLTAQRALLRAAAGHPMVLEFLVRDWQESGEQSAALSLDAMTTEPGSGGAAQVAFRDILPRITRSLQPTTHNVLNLAAVLGHRLNDMSMYTLVDLSLGQTISGMAELVDRRVLRDGATGLEFVNEMVRAAAYLGVPPTLRRVLHEKIAGWLLRSHDDGNENLGLEIAWHCMRAGRTQLAIPHLLRGARESTCRGAVHAAERALSSALPHLGDPEREEALVLLAELLQEQGRWSDSLHVIEQSASPSQAGRSQVLALQARFQLYGQDTEEASESLLNLLDIVRHDDDPSLRIAAAATATTLAASIRDQALTQPLLDALARIPDAGLNHEDRASLSLAKARLMFHVNDCASSLQEIEGATMFLQPPGAISTAAAQLQAGLGAISCMQGDYAKGRTFLQKGCEIAARLGNDSLQRGIAANLALVLGRLGAHTEQLQWAERSLSIGRGASADYMELLAAYCGAFACCALDRPSRALEFIESSGKRITGGLPRWALQGWLLYSADVYVLLGRPDQARAEALQAVEGINSVLHVSNFAGAFSRWTARLANDSRGYAIAMEKIEAFRSRLESFDALDKAEILAAVNYLQRRQGLMSDDIVNQLRSQLYRLPVPVTDHLVRLGILEYQESYRASGIPLPNPSTRPRHAL